MTTLQEYLNSLENKETVKQISLAQIQKEREEQGDTELLEGGELDLHNFTQLEELIVERQFLNTPLVRINIEGLNNLKELTWPNLDQLEREWKEKKPEDNEEQIKLWTELGIVSDTDKKDLVRELQRLSPLFIETHSTKLKLHFGTEKAPQEKLKDISSITEYDTEDTIYNIYLDLERKDKQDNFSPSLVLWSFAQELTHVLLEQKKLNNEISYNEKLNLRFSPLFWKHFWVGEASVLEWVKSNLVISYQGLVLNPQPTNFSTSKFDVTELLAIYLQDSNFENFYNSLVEGEKEPVELMEEKITLSNRWVNENWKIISLELIDLIEQSLNKETESQGLVKLWIKLGLEYNESSEEWTIKINYHPQTPVHKTIEQLIVTTPLTLELASLKQDQEKLPTRENFDKVNKANEELNKQLRNILDDKEYEDIQNKIKKT